MSAVDPSRVNGAPAISVSGLSAGYGEIRVLQDVSLAVPKGSVVALLGANGAGKTTLMHCLMGIVPAAAGSVSLGGEDVTKRRINQRVKGGACLIPEGRGIFPSLSVEENLRLQAPAELVKKNRDKALDAFPALKDRLKQRAGTMSGGQQQMLALARCFLAEPAIVLLDEVSIGLAPLVVDEIFEALKGLADEGVTLLIVEQYVDRALEMAAEVHILTRGRITLSAAPSDVTEDVLVHGYMGGDGPTQSDGQAPR